MGENKSIVRYHNHLNSITFYNFGTIDFDLFMSVCSKVAESGKKRVSISFDELRKMSGFNTHLSERDFIKSLDSMNLKQLLSHGRIEDNQCITRFVLFPRLIIDKNNRILTVEVNEDFKYILLELKKNFTRFELQEFVNLDSKYSKTLYRLLKQFRTTGFYKVSLEEFKELFSVPKSYSNMRIYDKIIKPSIKNVSKYFDNLTCKVLYERKRGRPIQGYEFTFTPENVQKRIPKKDEEKTKHKKKGANSFHNFDQREYDYDELERKLTRR